MASTQPSGTGYTRSGDKFEKYLSRLLADWERRIVMYKLAFGKRFSEVMAERGWDKKQAAAVFEVSETMISKYMEGGNFPETEAFLRMADILDVSADWLGGRSNLRQLRRNGDPPLIPHLMK